MIARVMDVWLYYHSASRAVFSGCLSDLGLGLGGLYLENIVLDSSGYCFTLFAMLCLLLLSVCLGAITVRCGEWDGLVHIPFISLCSFGMLDC